MKTLLACASILLFLAANSVRAASDADVTILKATKVTIEADVITIVAEAKTRITLIQESGPPASQGGDRWMGRAVTRVHIKSDSGTFIIQRPPHTPDRTWQETLNLARDLQDGKQIGRIGYYAPDMVIKGNLLDSVTGPAFLYGKGN